MNLLLDVQRVKGQKRCESQYDQARNHRIHYGQIVLEAKKSRRLSMSANPPISFNTKSSRVETSASGGRKNIRMMSGLLAKIINRPPTAARTENTPKMIRKAR